MPTKLKKNWFIISLSVVLFSLISIRIAQAGCVAIKVQYQDDNGCPRSGANVWIYSPINKEIGTTVEDGKVTNCDLDLSQGTYWVKAYWPIGTQFGPNVELPVNSNGDGSAIITDSDHSYPDGTESCGDSECDGKQYCVGDPKYIECNSWNTRCDTKACCWCDGGIKANPTEKPQTSVNEGNLCVGECTWCDATGTCANRGQCDGTECSSG
jgi:hypothetical protein